MRPLTARPRDRPRRSFALSVSARTAAAQGLPQPPAKGPIANERATMTQAALPILNYLANDDVCDSLIEVQNVGTTTTALSLVVWGAPGFCPAQAAGPLKIECSGPAQARAPTWNFHGDQVPQGAKSGMLFAFSTQSLSDIGLDGIFGFDDIIADLLCETAFFGVVGDADDWRRFKLAFDQGSVYAGIPMDLAYGSPIAAEVLPQVRRPRPPRRHHLQVQRHPRLPPRRLRPALRRLHRLRAAGLRRRPGLRVDDVRPEPRPVVLLGRRCGSSSRTTASAPTSARS